MYLLRKFSRSVGRVIESGRIERAEREAAFQNAIEVAKKIAESVRSGDVTADFASDNLKFMHATIGGQNFMFSWVPKRNKEFSIVVDRVPFQGSFDQKMIIQDAVLERAEKITNGQAQRLSDGLLNQNNDHQKSVPSFYDFP